MKLKRIVLGLGTALTIAAPIAAIVSCGPEKPPFHPEWKKDNDEKWNGDGQSDLGIINSANIISKMNGNFENFPIANYDIFEFAFNNKQDGIVPITRLQDFLQPLGSSQNAFMLNELIDTNVNGQNGKKQSLSQTVNTDGFPPESIYSNINALWKKDITKKQLIANPSLINDVQKQVSDFIKSKPNLQLGAFVLSNAIDKKDAKTLQYTSGEYSIYIFQLNNYSSQKIDSAKTMLQDKTKFGADVNALVTYGGTYTTAYGFGSATFSPDPSKSQNIFKVNVTPGAQDQYSDRTGGSSLKDYYLWGPLAAIAQSDIDSIQGLNFAAYYVKDQKTQLQNLIFTIIDGSLVNDNFVVSGISTIHIPVPELMNIVPATTLPADELKAASNSVINDLSFNKLNSILSSIAPNKEFLGGYPSTTPKIMEFFDALKLMYQYKPFITHKDANGDIDALKAFINALPTVDPNFNFNMFLQIIDWQKGKDFGPVGTYGGKRYQIIDVLPIFYEDLKKFIEMHPQYNTPEYVFAIKQDGPVRNHPGGHHE